MQNPLTNSGIRRYRGKYVVIQGLIVTLPFVGGMFTNKPVYIAPPLGTLGQLVSPLALLIVGLAAFVPYYINTRRAAMATLCIAALLTILSVVLYSDFVADSVVELDVTSSDVAVRVSVGKEETEFARQTFPNATPEKMVHDFGHREEDLQKLWRRRSLRSARLRLLWSFISIWAMLNICIGAMAKTELLSERHYGSVAA